jgi:predicted nucleic acid-binding protein
MSFLENRPGAAKVQELLESAMDGNRQILMSVVNWGEVYYSVWRAKGPGVAQKVLADISQLPVQVVDADHLLTQSAAELRAQHKLPYVDCFAAALAIHLKADLATSDQDFVHVKKKVKILWT